MHPKSLIDSFIKEKLLPELNGINYNTHHSEVDLIDSLDSFSPSPKTTRGGRIEVETYKIHKTPLIDYTLPNGVNVRKEIGDVLFDVEALLPMGEKRRRGFLAQAKFDTMGESWDVDTSQFRFIHHLPVFVFSRPKTAYSFNLEPKYTTSDDHRYTGNTFAVGLFGQNGRKPHFLRTERILKGIPHVEGALDLRYQRTANDNPEQESFTRDEFGEPTQHDYIDSVLEKFLRGQYGHFVATNSELERFMDHMEDIATSSNYSHLHHKSLCTDGGEREGSGFVYVKFTIDLRDSNFEIGEDVL